MKIAIDARIINSGTGRYIERLLHYLQQLDHFNEYLILVRRADLNYFKPSAPNFKVVEADFKDYSFGEQLGFARLLKKLKPDLVHFCMPQQPLIYSGVTVTSVLDLNILRMDVNDMNPVELRVKKTIFAALLRKVLKRSRQIITISKYSKEDILRFSHINPNKITVAYLAADKAPGKPKEVKAYKNVPFIMYVGRAEAYKNNRGLIKAHQQLLATHPDLRLIIIGRKDDLREADIKWVRDNGFKNVDFLGFVADDELAWLYQNTLAYVFPSFMEGFGLPGLEAMLYGAPVAASNASCIPEILGDAAEYFDPSRPEDIAKVVNELITNQTERSALIKRGHAQAAKYSWRRMAEQVLGVYKKALGQKTD